jgi:D-alanyl-D-alanine carboxypeptidase/D-alanyl-D-alanine-endopeptidase (penicillin-binding protein 4)
LRRSLLLVSFVVASACATAKPPAPSLTSRIDAIINAAPFERAIWGIDVVDDAGHVLYAHNPSTLLIPASNRKLFSAATVAACEGLDAQLTTELWRNGDDLILRGAGDPSMGGRLYGNDPRASFAPMIEALKSRGVVSVRDVIADVSLFDRERIPGTWEVEDVGTFDGAPVDALAWNENAENGAAVADPALYAAQAFAETLRAAGIPVTGTLRVAEQPPPRGERIASIASPLMIELLSIVLKPSQNLYAETLYKGLTGSYAASEELERRFLTAEVGIDAGDFSFRDGCGLSRRDLVTPRATVALLRWMNDPVRRGAWWLMLATPGEEGTLHRRLVPLAARLRGKTGTLTGVNALSGIVARSNGGYRYFSIVLNHHLAGSAAAVRAIDAIASEVAQ